MFSCFREFRVSSYQHDISLLTKSCLTLFENHRFTPPRRTSALVGVELSGWKVSVGDDRGAHESEKIWENEIFAIYKQLYGGEVEWNVKI